MAKKRSAQTSKKKTTTRRKKAKSPPRKTTAAKGQKKKATRNRSTAKKLAPEIVDLDLGKTWFPSDVNDFTLKLAANDKLVWNQHYGERLKNEGCLEANVPVRFTNVEKILLESDSVKRAAEAKSFQGEKVARAMISFSNGGASIAYSLRFNNESTPEYVPNFDKRCDPHVDAFWVSKPLPISVGEVDKKTKLAKFMFSPDATADVLADALFLREPLISNNDVQAGATQLAEETGSQGSSDLPFRAGEGEGNSNDFPAVKLLASNEKCTANAKTSGLIVFAGETGTGKSMYARALVLRHMLRLAEAKPEAPPNLVTFEDPIEGWKLESQAVDGAWRPTLDLVDMKTADSDLQAGIRVVARQKVTDVGSLRKAYQHALRQKPSVVYIGEVRTQSDWRVAIELGATGHLVVTTCHAASLIDTFVKIAGRGQRDAQDRRQLADSLLGVVHLRNQEMVEEFPASIKVHSKLSTTQTFLKLWRRTNESVSNFVVDGLSSLVPDGDNILSSARICQRVLEMQQEFNHLIDQSNSLTDEDCSEVRSIAVKTALFNDRNER